MSSHCACLSRLFTVEYTKQISVQIVQPMQTILVKPNELKSALCLLLHIDHPFMDVFFLANKYLCAMGIPRLANGGKMRLVTDIAQWHGHH
ncbi:hypothetical protein K443DRAFT_5061 [Laccaria amethystina LaAM-08-1]|uniref:Uncharacterized protein n=1 Tax=Laccaria amethystina LaAM-08-1 TaxID=1095629 RepID=A0A0C9XQI6_9AGAR|nr:hypothetical protein K443DRAFT_5061 [Laccaria amethystina LaAM-08-1]